MGYIDEFGNYVSDITGQSYSEPFPADDPAADPTDQFGFATDVEDDDDASFDPLGSLEDIDIATGVEPGLSLYRNITHAIQLRLRAWGDENGESDQSMDDWLWGNQSEVNRVIRDNLVGGGKLDDIFNTFGSAFGADTSTVQNNLMKSPAGFNYLVEQVMSGVFGLGADAGVTTKTTGGGQRGLTPTEIRNKFDIDQLTEQATQIWRTNLLTEPDDARGMASAFVEAVVATKGEKVIDFQTFIEKRAKATNRWASIYKDKPPSMNPQQYLQPYFQAAQQVLRPRNAADVAIGGAQFGSSAATFGARLQRSNEVRTSSNFINQIQGRLSNLSGIFKG